MTQKFRVLVVGCGNMGSAHARAYQKIADYEIAGLVSLHPEKREALNRSLGGSYPLFDRYETALEATRPDAVSINTYPDTHAAYAIQAMRAGAHIFVEKPIAVTVEDAQRVAQEAQKTRRKLVVGYILRQHPTWARFIETARALGKPLVMRINQNQQSSGKGWEGHKRLMLSAPPFVDSGVHYIDVMCQMAGARPVRVSAIGARLTEELKPGMVNYGHLEVVFEDGSVGWYEAGWGPMMSETAVFVRDVIGPRGSVSIVDASGQETSGQEAWGQTDKLEHHTRAGALRLHHAALDETGRFAQQDEIIELRGEPDHDTLCELEQRFLLQAIREDLDLTAHLNDAINSLRIVLAADEAVRTGRTVELAPINNQAPL